MRLMFKYNNSGPLNGINACVNNINSDFQKIDTWAKNNALCSNPTKSKCILINRSNKKIGDDIRIKIDSNLIEFASCSKNFGVIFNNKLTWCNHIASRVGKIYGVLRNLWSVNCSTSFKILLRFSVLKNVYYMSSIIANQSKNKYVSVSLKLFINRTTSVPLFKVIQQQL